VDICHKNEIGILNIIIHLKVLNSINKIPDLIEEHCSLSRNLPVCYVNDIFL